MQALLCVFNRGFRGYRGWAGPDSAPVASGQSGQLPSVFIRVIRGPFFQWLSRIVVLG